MASKRHQELLLAVPGIQIRKRFRTSVVRALTAAFPSDCQNPEEHGDGQAECDADCSSHGMHLGLFEHPGSYAPDGFTLAIDQELNRVELVIYEVDLTHAPEESTLQKYAELWFAFDSVDSGWVVRLVIVDKFGNHNEVSLCDLWHQFHAQDLAQPVCSYTFLPDDLARGAKTIDLKGLVRVEEPPCRLLPTLHVTGRVPL